MIRLLCAKILHVFTYAIWFLLPLLIISLWFYTLAPLAVEAIRYKVKVHQKLKEKVLLWYLKSS